MTDTKQPAPAQGKRKKYSKRKLLYHVKRYKLMAETYREMYLAAQKAITDLHDYYLKQRWKN